MAVYITVLIVVYVLSYQIKTSTRYLDGSRGEGKIQINKICWIPTVGVCVVLALCEGLRDHVGTDFSTYKGLFEYYMTQPLVDTLQANEGLFYGVASIVGKLSGNVTIIFLFFAVLISFLEIPTVVKFSINVPLSIFLYITTMQYYMSFNGIRQCTAAAVLFAALPLLLQRKWIKYFGLIAVLFFVHNSVVLMIPFAIAASMNPKSKTFNGLILTFLIVFYLFPGALDGAFSILAPDNYQHYVSFNDPTDDGVNILRVLVAAVPVVLCRGFYNRMITKAEEPRLFRWLVNFSTINLMILILATRSTVMARFGMYTSVYNVLLIPYLLRLIVREQRKVAMVIIMVLFFAYMFMLLPTESNLLPYRTVFG